MSPADKIKIRALIIRLRQVGKRVMLLRGTKAKDLGGVIYSLAAHLEEILIKMR